MHMNYYLNEKYRMVRNMIKRRVVIDDGTEDDDDNDDDGMDGMEN